MLRNSWVGRYLLVCCVLAAGMLTSVPSASAKGGTDVAGLYEFHAYGVTAAEPDRGEQLMLVGRFQLGQHLGNILGGALGEGPCDTGNGRTSMDILGSSSGSSVTFTATSLFLECELTFTGTLAGETLEGEWSIALGDEECEADSACEGKFKAQRLQKLPTEEEEIEAREAKEKQEREEREKREKEEKEEEENEDDEEPAVTSVTDQSTGTNSGSILGGDTLIVQGSGFKVSDEEEAEVQFYLGSSMVASSEVTPISGSEIEVEAPKLFSSAASVPEGATGLTLDVRVQITYEDEDGETKTVTSPSGNGAGPDVFEALIPEVDSVTDEATGNNSGSILGGDTLRVKGTGFQVPAGGKATVSFQFGDEVLGEPIEVTPLSTTEIEVKAPNLSKYASKIQSGDAALVSDVIVSITGSGSETVKSEQAEASAYSAVRPVITKVLDETTATNKGSILGGQTLRITGQGFDVPPGGKEELAFDLGSKTLKSVLVTPTSSTEIQVTLPDLAAFTDNIAAGKDALPLNLVIATEDSSHNSVESANQGDGTGPESFQAEEPEIDSIEDDATHTIQGSILGGDTLTIKGHGMTVPQGGRADVAFSIYGTGKTIATSTEQPGPNSSGGEEIETTMPNLAEYLEDITDEGASRLKLEVTDQIFDAEDNGVSSKSETTVFEAVLPKIESIVDSSTGTHSGSILGHDTLLIKGSGFKVPQGNGEAVVHFFHEGPQIAQVTGKVLSDSEIEVLTPELAKDVIEIPENTNVLKTAVSVEVGNPQGMNESAVSSTEDPGAIYEALLPQITSVTDQQTGTNSGSILGGDTLVVKGSGFESGLGGNTKVEFFQSEEELASEAIEPISDTEIQVTAPDLAKFLEQIPEGKQGLPLDLRVVLTDGLDAVESDSELTGTGPDSYEARPPVINSLEDEQSGTDTGSILGGEKLLIKGSGFQVPQGNGEAVVHFFHEGPQVAQVTGKVLSNKEIEVIAPDLAKYQEGIPEDEKALKTVVSVEVGELSDPKDSVPTSTLDPGAVYEAHMPEIDSVENISTRLASGSILGGTMLRITGTGFIADGQVEVRFFHEGPQVAQAKATAVSSTEIEVEAPNLTASASDIPDGQNALELKVSVEVGELGNEEAAASTSTTDPGADYEALLPKVDSVLNETTGKDSGAIAGGEKLLIEGSGFDVPEGGSAVVDFEADGKLLEEVTATPIDPSLIQLNSPDLSTFTDEIPKGESSLITDVRVLISDKEQHTITSEVAGADEFNFDTLAITSGEQATFTVGKHGSFAITTEGTEPVTLEETGELPDGVSFTLSGKGAGELAGTPAAGSAGVYQFTIKASNGKEPDATQDFTLTVKDVPGAPEDVQASAAVGSATVSWSPPASDGQAAIESYVVSASPGGATVTVDGSATSATIEGLSDGTAYAFSVAAKNELGTGEAAQSNSIVATSTAIENPTSGTSSTPGGTASTQPISSSSGTTLTANASGEGTVDVGSYASDPVAQLGEASGFFDVSTSPHNSFTSLTFQICGVNANTIIKWWNPASETWTPVSNQTAPSGTPLCVTVTVNTSTSPSLSQLYGTVFAVAASPPSSPSTPTPTSTSSSSSSPLLPAPAVASATVSLQGTTIAVQGSGAQIKLACTGTGTCAGKLTLTLSIRPKGKKRAKTQTIATANFSIPAGKTATIKLELSATGGRLLSAAHGRLNASLTISKSSPAPAQTQTAKIRLVQYKAKTRKK